MILKPTPYQFRLEWRPFCPRPERVYQREEYDKERRRKIKTFKTTTIGDHLRSKL